MSKKINIVTPGISHSSLWDLFTKYVSRKVEEEKEYWRSVGRSLGGRYSYLYDDEYDDEMRKLREYYNGTSDDDYYVDDDGCIIFPPNSSNSDYFEEDEYFKKLNKLNSKGKKKHTKHRSRHRSKGTKIIDINTPYSGFEEEPDEIGGSIKIYYYPNYQDKYDRIEFDSLIEFDEYCQQEGFLVPPYIGEKLAYKPVSHCCLNPYARERGVLEIMAEESYADMMYEACEETDLLT